MALGPEEDAWDAELGRLTSSKHVGHALYERTPLGEERIIAKHQYTGTEHDLILIASRHITDLFGAAAKSIHFRKARAAAQRIDDYIYFTLAYPEDYRANQERHPSTAAGTRAYILIVKAESKQTQEHPSVKALIAFAPRLIRNYLIQGPNFGSQIAAFYSDARSVIPQPGQVKFETGHQKIKLLDDIITSTPKSSIASDSSNTEFLDMSPEYTPTAANTKKPAEQALLPSLAAYARLTDYLAGERIPADAPEGITQAMLFIRAQIDAFAAYAQNLKRKPEKIPPLFERLYQAHDGTTKELQRHIGELRTDYTEATSILSTIAERLERSVGEKT